jgi:hypothetical protein
LHSWDSKKALLRANSLPGGNGAGPDHFSGICFQDKKPPEMDYLRGGLVKGYLFAPPGLRPGYQAQLGRLKQFRLRRKS